MRVKHKPWAKDYIHEQDTIFINSYIEDVDKLQELLNQYDEIHMEIGCGKGRFICEHAKNNPNILYLAVERQASVIVSAAKKIDDLKISNLKLYNGDIFNLKDFNLFQNKLDKIYLNFSDPWPKVRHEKRRLTSSKFLILYKELLKINKEIELKTDNSSLFEYSLISFNNQKIWDFEEVYLDLHSEDKANIKTEYEEKFSNKGFSIKYLKVKLNNK